MTSSKDERNLRNKFEGEAKIDKSRNGILGKSRGHPDFIIPVSVHVTDVNDNTPQFVGRTPYRLNISELTVVSASLS